MCLHTGGRGEGGGRGAVLSADAVPGVAWALDKANGLMYNIARLANIAM